MTAPSIASLPLDTVAAARFEIYLALILKWNARISLTADRDPAQLIARHFAECIFAARQIPDACRTLLDYGSGTGLPGIPIAILRPGIDVTLAESQSRKAAFLREAVRTLELRAAVWDRRVEDMLPGRIFDVVALRAVDKMAKACRAAATRLAPDGRLVAFATTKTEAALERVEGIAWEATIPIPGSEHGVLKIGRSAEPLAPRQP
jgi:16S rRNA (guanine527-N7)-methyltransferase